MEELLATLIRRLHLRIRQEVLGDLRAAGHTRLTAAHMYIFQSPGPEGSRPTELATRTNMTKQAMNHLLARLEEDGYLQRRASATDGRASVIHLTRRGRDVERIMMESAARLEKAWSRSTGRETIEELRALLRELNAVASE